MAVRLTWEKQGVLLEFFGIVSMSDYREGLADTFADQRYLDIRYAICDYSGLSNSEFAPEHVEAVATFTAGIEKIENVIVAVVATNSETINKAKLYATYVTYPFAIFSNMADARKWIGHLD